MAIKTIRFSIVCIIGCSCAQTEAPSRDETTTKSCLHENIPESDYRVLTDDAKLLCEYQSSEDIYKIDRNIEATFALVKKPKLEKVADTNHKHDTPQWRWKNPSSLEQMFWVYDTNEIGATQTKIPGLCPDENFAKLPALATCSGVLIDSDKILTAGHCIREGQEDDFLVVFDYTKSSSQLKERKEIKPPPRPAEPPARDDTDDSEPEEFFFRADYTERKADSVQFSPVYFSEVYEIDEIIESYNVDYYEYAVATLKKPVKRRSPVPRRVTGIIPDDARVYAVGHPTGLPKAITGAYPGSIHSSARLIDNKAPNWFSADLNLYAQNSGSPVFNSETHILEGIFNTSDSYGARLKKDWDANCHKANYCWRDSQEFQCKNGTRLELKYAAKSTRTMSIPWLD